MIPLSLTDLNWGQKAALKHIRQATTAKYWGILVVNWEVTLLLRPDLHYLQLLTMKGKFYQAYYDSDASSRRRSRLPAQALSTKLHDPAPNPSSQSFPQLTSCSATGIRYSTGTELTSAHRREICPDLPATGWARWQRWETPKEKFHGSIC